MERSAIARCAASAATTPRPARGGSHLWIPRIRGGAALLLALALDRDRGHPDNCSATGRQIGVDRETVRSWRTALLGQGLIGVVDGYLVPTEPARALLRAGCDPLPRPLLRGSGPRPTPAVLRAAAVVYADAIGWRSERRGCRNDAERAALVGVSRETVIAGRLALAEAGLVGVEAVRRGRADLRRVRLAEGRRATHGRPLGAERAGVLAERARRGRSRLAGGAVPVDSEGAVPADSPMQSPRGTLPMQAPSAPADGCPIAAKPDGCSSTGRGHGREPETASEILRGLLPDLPSWKADRAAAATAGNDRAVAELRRLAGDRRALQRLLAMPRAGAAEQLLAATGVYDRAPRRRASLAVQVGRALAAEQLLALAADVVLGRPRRVAAVLLARLRRVTGGDGEAMTRCRAGWPLERLLEALRAGGERVAPSEPTAAGGTHPHDVHRGLALLAAGEAAQAGDWRRVDDLALRHRLSIADIADRASVDERELQERLTDLAVQRLAAMTGRATA